MIRISLIYDHHKRTRKDEEGPVEVRVTVNRKPYYIYTGVRVHESRLVCNAVRDIKVKDADGRIWMTDDADVLNERLTTIVRLVEREVNMCLEERRNIDIADIRRKVWNIAPSVDESDEPTLINWIRETAAKADISVNTKKRYTTLCNHLADFGKMVRWEQLTVDNIYAWDVWLRQQEVQLTDNQRKAGVEVRKISSDSVFNYHKCLKAMLNRALKFEKIKVNPYDRLKGVFRRSNREVIDYLTDEQMQKIIELTPVPGSQAALARDLFIFQMFTGLGYADTQIFDIGMYRREKTSGTDRTNRARTFNHAEQGERWVYIGERVKTGVPYVSMLLPPVVDVLKRNGWKVPKMNNQRYNQMLKAIGMCIGIERLHSHMARHTFATWMLSQGAKIENVSRMLGHTNITQTQRYAKVLAKDVYDDFEMIEKKLKNR